MLNLGAANCIQARRFNPQVFRFVQPIRKLHPKPHKELAGEAGVLAGYLG